MVVAVTGCSGPSGAAPPEDGGSFETIQDLQKALEAAGQPCPELVMHNHAKYSAASGSCGETTALAVYSGDASLASQLDQWKPIGQRAINVGSNWTVEAVDPQQIQKKLGGYILKTGQ